MDSAGLAPGGALNGDCGSSTGQVYSRSGFFDGKFGIMYSYYMPKDQILAIYPYLGHRNDVSFLSQQLHFVCIFKTLALAVHPNGR